ncbi:MAG: thioesterase, FlK family [Candidatus Nanopelagicales bacterium]
MPLSYVVSVDDTALALGSGDVPVLATPRLIAWMEAATVAAADDLPARATTVGIRVDVEHLLATPVGAAVTASAEVVERAERSLTFEVTAHHDIGAGPELIARGRVTRAIVERERFLSTASRPLIIRRALPAEWDWAGEVCVEGYSAGYGLSSEEDDYVHVLRDVAGRAADSEVLVALEQGEVVGTVTVLRPGEPLAQMAEPGEVEFRFMAVRPDRWGGGMGRALLEAVSARAEGKPLICCVIEGNDPAVALYRSCGFEPVPDRDWEPVPGVLLRAFRR